MEHSVDVIVNIVLLSCHVASIANHKRYNSDWLVPGNNFETNLNSNSLVSGGVDASNFMKISYS